MRKTNEINTGIPPGSRLKVFAARISENDADSTANPPMGIDAV